METVQRDAALIEHDIDALADRYAFADRAAVVHFLRDRSWVVAVLLEAAEVIPRYFPSDRPVTLEVVNDPETPEDVELYARMPTHLASEAALERLDRFHDEWWLDALPATGHVLTMTIERA